MAKIIQRTNANLKNKMIPCYASVNIDGFGFGEIDGFNSDGIYKIKKPTSDNISAGQLVITLPGPTVTAGNQFYAFPGSSSNLAIKYSGSAPSVGDDFGCVAGSFMGVANNTGYKVVGVSGGYAFLVPFSSSDPLAAGSFYLGDAGTLYVASSPRETITYRLSCAYNDSPQTDNAGSFSLSVNSSVYNISGSGGWQSVFNITTDPTLPKTYVYSASGSCTNDNSVPTPTYYSPRGVEVSPGTGSDSDREINRSVNVLVSNCFINSLIGKFEQI